MIEDIQALRQAARLTPDNENQDEKVWCIAAGNVNLIDDIAYKAIASKHSVKILFREHVILKDKRLNKKFYPDAAIAFSYGLSSLFTPPFLTKDSFRLLWRQSC